MAPALSILEGVSDESFCFLVVSASHESVGLSFFAATGPRRLAHVKRSAKRRTWDKADCLV